MQLLLSKEDHDTVKFKWLSRLPRFNLFHVRTNLLFELVSNPCLAVFLMLSLSFKHYLSKIGSSTFTKEQPFSYKYYFQARERKNLRIPSLQNSSYKIFPFSVVALCILCFDVERTKEQNRRRFRWNEAVAQTRSAYKSSPEIILNVFLPLPKYIPDTGQGATGAVSALVILH